MKHISIPVKLNMNGLFCHFLRTCLYKGFFTLMELCWSKDPGEKHCTTVEFCTMATSPLFQTDYSLRGLDFQARVFAKIAVYFSCPKCLLTVISFKLLFLLGRESNNEGEKKQVACSKGIIWKEKGHSKRGIPTVLNNLRDGGYSCISK